VAVTVARSGPACERDACPSRGARTTLGAVPERPDGGDGCRERRVRVAGDDDGDDPALLVHHWRAAVAGLHGHAQHVRAIEHRVVLACCDADPGVDPGDGRS
jgi:hypothetical protein